MNKESVLRGLPGKFIMRIEDEQLVLKFVFNGGEEKILTANDWETLIPQWIQAIERKDQTPTEVDGVQVARSRRGNIQICQSANAYALCAFSAKQGEIIVSALVCTQIAKQRQLQKEDLENYLHLVSLYEAGIRDIESEDQFYTEYGQLPDGSLVKNAVFGYEMEMLRHTPGIEFIDGSKL